MYLALDIIPIDCWHEVLSAPPVHVDFEVFFEDTDEVFYTVLLNILHPKVINNQGVVDQAAIVLPISWHHSALAVSCFAEVFGDAFLCNESGRTLRIIVSK
jgi:hypothetical protein